MLRVKTLTALCLAVATLGCASTGSSDTARTGTEQLLISNAVDQSLSKVDFETTRGRKVHVVEKYLESVDKNYVVASVRHRILRQGGRLVEKPEDADMIMELRSGGIGTDKSDSFIGMPEITLPGLFTLPEVRLISKTTQTGTAKIGLVAYDAKDSHVMGAGGVSTARSDQNYWYAFGVGPYQNGTLRNELNESVQPVPGQELRKLPTQVAFKSDPVPQNAPGTVRFASDEQNE